MIARSPLADSTQTGRLPEHTSGYPYGQQVQQNPFGGGYGPPPSDPYATQGYGHDPQRGDPRTPRRVDWFDD